MKRRAFFGAATAVAASSLAMPAIAQSSPKVSWRMTSGFPNSLDTLYGAGKLIAQYVSDATDGNFSIDVFAAGEIVPTAQAADAVMQGTVEAAHTASYYYWGKDPTWQLPTTVPFGLDARGMNAWFYYGGGNDLCNAFFNKQGIVAYPAGNTGAQMGGWFRKEINTPADFQGVKFRLGGFAGLVLKKLGIIPQSQPPAEIYESLEKGTIDAAEFVGPYDDEKLGFNKVAKYYYYPGWWEGGPQLSMYVNIAKWQSLPPSYQAILEAAAAEANVTMLAKYDAQNMPALRRLVEGGTILRPFTKEVMEASYTAAFQLYDETSAANAKFKKIYDAWKPFRDEQYLWFRVAENSFDNFVYAKSAEKG